MPGIDDYRHEPDLRYPEDWLRSVDEFEDPCELVMHGPQPRVRSGARIGKKSVRAQVAFTREWIMRVTGKIVDLAEEFEAFDEDGEESLDEVVMGGKGKGKGKRRSLRRSGGVKADGEKGALTRGDRKAAGELFYGTFDEKVKERLIRTLERLEEIEEKLDRGCSEADCCVFQAELRGWQLYVIRLYVPAIKVVELIDGTLLWSKS
jgi:hypothetical protein